MSEMQENDADLSASINPTLSQHLLVLRAAVVLSCGSENHPFSRIELALEAWRMTREVFGLEGHKESHPDVNKVWSALAGKKGVVARGWIEKVSTGMYRVTPAGRIVLANVLNGEPPDSKPSDVAAMIADEIALKLLGSTAAALMDARESAKIRFVDACRFWGITGDETNPLGVIGRLEFRLAAGDEDEHARAALRLSEWLRDKFKHHLKLMEGRGRGHKKTVGENNLAGAPS